MIIQHNMEAANAQRQYKINVGEKSRTVEKLSSGYRINRAADDAACKNQRTWLEETDI